MNTDQLMQVSFGPAGSFEIFHKSQLGNLTQLWRVGETYRLRAGKRPSNISMFLDSKATQEFISVICQKQGKALEQVLHRVPNEDLLADIHLMIYAAEYLSTEFHYEVISEFVKGRLLQVRDETGDSYKLLTATASAVLGLPYGSPQEEKMCKAVAYHIRKVCGIRKDESWNEASAQQLKRRWEITEQLIIMLNLGAITTQAQLETFTQRMGRDICQPLPTPNLESK